MALVDIAIGGRQYELTCRDGEEEHLRLIARMVDRKAAAAAEAMGGLNESRQLLLAALLLADEINDLSAATTKAPSDSPTLADASLATAIERLADRMESLAERVERETGNA
jgi:cell division protein ZapA